MRIMDLVPLIEEKVGDPSVKHMMFQVNIELSTARASLGIKDDVLSMLIESPYIVQEAPRWTSRSKEEVEEYLSRVEELIFADEQSSPTSPTESMLSSDTDDTGTTTDDIMAWMYADLEKLTTGFKLIQKRTKTAMCVSAAALVLACFALFTSFPLSPWSRESNTR